MAHRSQQAPLRCRRPCLADRTPGLPLAVLGLRPERRSSTHRSSG
ncbi:hypothetical protein ACFPM0_24060 [Pseudonocardia sulfidoxydans]